MRYRAILAACVVLALSHAHRSVLGAQTAVPAIHPDVVTLALAAATDEARDHAITAHPEIMTDAGRRAIVAAAGQKAAAGEIASAFNGHRTLMAAAIRAGDERARILALNQIGFLAGQTGDFLLAEPSLLEVRLAAEATHDSELFINASNNLGIVQRLQGKYEEAIGSYQRTLASALAAGRRDAVARAYNNLGIVALQQGDLRTALDYLVRSLAIKEELGQTQDLITTAANIGVIHHRQRNFPTALAYFERSLADATRAGFQRARVIALEHIGEIHALEGRYDRAKDALRQALATAEAQGDRLAAGRAWHSLGSLAKRERHGSEAEAAFERSRAIREATGDKPGLAETLTAFADLYQSQGEHERALGFAERSVEVARAIGPTPGLGSALGLLGSANAALGRTEPAVRALQESIDIVERIRSQVAGGAQDVQRFFEDKSEPYYALAAVHAASGNAAGAFAAVERARARVLLDLIQGGKPIARALNAKERDHEAELDRELLALNLQIAAASRETPVDATRRRVLDDNLTRARRAKDEWQFETYGAHPDLRFGRGEAPIVSLAEAATVAPPGTAIAMFMSGVDRTLLMMLTRVPGQDALSLRSYTIPIARDDLTRRAQAFRQQLAQRDLGFAATARTLYTSLLGPADRELQRIGRLVIVPDGALWDVPFQALITPRGRFLIEERTLSYTPSVSALYRLSERRQGRATGSTRLVAIGDPEGGPATSAGRLPEAAREVRSLARMYGSTSEAFVGPEATEARLRLSAPTASVLHIATHGELVTSSPMYSYVTLAGQGQTENLSQDGRVEAWEIANMTLEANLVVLSACETARGGNGGGEGVVGLSWSLFAAGASTAAVSLWRVDSASTTSLMLAFHESLRQGAGAGLAPAEAMRTASRAMLASSRYRHPFYWAGFVVVGAP